MRRLILGLMLASAVSSATATEYPVEKGAVDLLQDTTLSQPFTIFDQLLLGLDQKAREIAKEVPPDKNDFRVSRMGLSDATSTVVYDKSRARTSIQFGLYLSGIDDPWQDVCAKHLGRIAVRLALPHRKYWDTTARGFFLDLLGPRILSDAAELAAYKVFSDSIAVTRRLIVESGDQAKPLKFIGYCFLDNKTGHVSFLEQKL
jgi:hypothetical protein